MKRISLAICGLMLTVACGGGGGASTYNPSSTPPSIIISLAPSATTNIDAGQSVKFNATVSNDSSAKGVSWSCASPGSSTPSCGTFTNTTTTSATYNAPAAVTSGTSFTVTATSIADSSKSQSATVKVFPLLHITTTTLAAATVNSAYSATVQASGGVPPLAWSLPSGQLPSGLTLGPSGAISGIPTSPGTFNFTVAATDSSASTMMQAQPLALTVRSTSSLTITTSQLPSASPNANYSATLQASGGFAPLTWSLASGALPTGLALSTSGVISGDPTVPGAFSFVVQVTDSNTTQPGGPSSAQAQFAIAVVSGLTVNSTTFPAGAQGNPYLEQVTASGGTLPYRWQVSSGSLAPGLTLQVASGTISGNPQTAGNYAFQLTVTDSSPTPQSASNSFTLVIVGASPLTITTISLLDATVDAPYQAMIAATGGTSPYHWSLVSGAFPSNVSLNAATGAMTGTPTLTVTSTFTVQVTDSSATPQLQTQVLSLAVNAAAEACTSSGNNGALSGSYAFSLSGFNDAGFITVAGSFTADGTGKVTAGEADASGVMGAQHGAILASASSYSVGPDNRGCATLATPFGTFATHFVLGSFSSNVATLGRAIEWDSPSSSAYVATGELLRQDPASFAAGPSGGYIFRTIGWDPGDQGGREVCVGVLTAAGNTLSGLEQDCNDAWNIASAAVPDAAGTFTSLDANGRGTAIISNGIANSNLVLYAVSSSELFVVNADSAPFASGEWVEQTPPAGGVGFTQASLTGNMVFYLNGLSLGGTASTASIEIATADGTSALAINFYEDRAGTMQNSDPLTCTYSVEPSGRVYISSDTPSCGSNVPVLYLSALNTGFIMSAAPGVDTGSIEPQMAGPFTSDSLQGNFIGGTAEIVSHGVPAELEPVAPNGGGSIAGSTEISSMLTQDAGAAFPASAYSVNSNGTFNLGAPGTTVSGIIISPSKFVMLSPSTLATSLPTLLVMEK